MYDIILLNLKSAYYGVLVGVFAQFFVRLLRRSNKEKSRNGRFVLKLAAFTFLWLSLKNILRFSMDMYDLYDGSLCQGACHGIGHLLEMAVIPFMGVTLRALASLKAIRTKELIVSQTPVMLCTLLFLITRNLLFEKICLFFVLGYAVVIIVTVPMLVRQYQKVLNDTYANTSERGVTWVLHLMYTLIAILVVWALSAFAKPSLLSETLYYMVSLLLWVIFAYKIYRQNFNIDYMHLSDEEDEAIDEEDVVVAPVPADGVAISTTNRFDIAVDNTVPLKAWQEAAFGESIEKFCTQVENFSNTDLSIVDVARGVGSNRTYVSRWCRENGTDFSSYIINIRLDYADQLLEKTNYSIADIVVMSGFSNSRHFRTVFFARHNCTPTEYRQSFAQGTEGSEPQQ